MLVGVMISIGLIIKYFRTSTLISSDSRQRWRWSINVALSLTIPVLVVVLALGLFGSHSMSDGLSGRFTAVACFLPLPILVFAAVTLGIRLNMEHLLKMYSLGASSSPTLANSKD